MLFAEGPVDSNHPPAADIAQLFEGRLTLLDKDMSAALQVAKFREAKLHALITVAGWTYGHLAEVLAALGSGPHPIPVINWLGWSGGLMYMPEAVHYTIAGQLALSTRQRLERGDKRERIAQLSCYQPYQGHPSHRCTDRALTRKDFNLPSCEESFIYCFDGTTNRIDKEVLFCWLRIVFRVHGSVLLLLHKPIYMRARIMRWTQEFKETVEPHFDPTKVIFRPVQKKAYFWALLRLVGECGACIDSVEPIGPHTGVSDSLCNHTPFLTWQSENGMQSRIALEVLAAAGVLEECAAKDRASFVEHAVRFGQNRQLQIALRSFLQRCDTEGINLFDQPKVPGAVLRIVDMVYESFEAAGRNWKQLVDIDVCASQNPVQLFKDSPEASAIAAVSEKARSQAETRQQLLDQMLKLREPLDGDMANSALQVMKEHQEHGLILHSIVGDGGNSIVISATAERNINSDVPAGKELALKLMKYGWPYCHVKNSSLGREGISSVLLESRLRNHEFSDIIASPVYVWSTKTRRCFWGCTKPKPGDAKENVLVFLCTELLTQNFRNVLRPIGAEWRSTAVISERMQEECLRPFFQTVFALHKVAEAAMMDVKPANFALRPNGHLVALDLGAMIVFERTNARHAHPTPAPLGRNITKAYVNNALESEAAAGKSVRANPVKGRVLNGSKSPNSELLFFSNQTTMDFCRDHFEKGKGFGRISQGTRGYADQAARRKRGDSIITAREGSLEDMFGCGRSLLKDLVGTSLHKEFEASALKAAEDGPEGIKRLLLRAVDPGLVVTQTIHLDDLCSLLAGVLNSNLDARVDALQAMSHRACTSRVYPPHDYKALFGGPEGPSEGGPPGIEMPGGPAESLPENIRHNPHLVGKTLPPLLLQQQKNFGVGVKLLRATKKGEPVCVYGGQYRACHAPGSAYPSRYCVTTRAADGIKDDAFFCDAGPSKRCSFQWIKDTHNAGPLMNGFDDLREEVNCTLNRNTAWKYGDDVWFVVYANRDIAEGEFIMWKYNPYAGSGLLAHGKPYSFE